MSLRKYRFIRSFFRNDYKITDLKTRHRLTNGTLSNRQCVKIAIIDDEDVSEQLVECLRRKGFDITTITSIEHINLLSEFHVIISDVNGVAVKIDPQKQGLGLIMELSRLYPQKALAIYSGSTHKLNNLPEGVMVINKDDDIDTWTGKIDKLIEKVTDPIVIWKLIASNMVKAEVPASVMACIEDDFVCRVINKQDFSTFPDDNVNLGSDLRSVLSGLVSNILFATVVK